ncbi:hypothetical protein RIEPE_0175 [Candidatus Riesia pediculicola USDA]|uniref:Uncharacterized protein n=1 Tax=Riesia pediculicola (strain USDA) TaxID=515618 RepID=D4G7Y3_RIEPU|nr:hypothetical protein RIEPE_0175 [Candidatus Riesia pediculicola USDA]
MFDKLIKKIIFLEKKILIIFQIKIVIKEENVPGNFGKKPIPNIVKKQ